MRNAEITYEAHGERVGLVTYHDAGPVFSADEYRQLAADFFAGNHNDQSCGFAGGYDDE